MYVRVMYAAIYSIIHACAGLYAGDVGRDVNIWCFFGKLIIGCTKLVVNRLLIFNGLHKHIQLYNACNFVYYVL